MVELREATALPLDDLAALLQAAFTNYVVPVDFSVPTLHALVERDDVLLGHSLVAYNGEQPVGVALLAVRPDHQGTRARVAGIGVVEKERRDGVGRTLLEGVIERAQANGARNVVLEVFASNEAARHLYIVCGFSERRRLLGFTLSVKKFSHHKATAVTLRPIAAPLALPIFASCAASETSLAQAPWQLEPPSLVRLGPSAAIYAIERAGESHTVGYVAVGIGEARARLHGIGVIPSSRRKGLATAALAAFFSAHPSVVDLSIGQLVPETSSLVPFFIACGAQRAVEEQMEMFLAI